MPLNNSGPISIGGSTAGQSINLELGRAATASSNLNESALRTLAGVIAQEVELVLPKIVSKDNSRIKNVAYSNIVGLLIEAIKEQQKQIDELKQLLLDQNKS